MSSTTIDTVVECFEDKKLAKNEFVLKQGKVCEYAFLVDGLMRAYTIDIKGEEITTNFFCQKRAAYDPESFFLQKPSNENIQAITDCLIYSTSFTNLNKLFHTLPEFRDYGRTRLVNDLVFYKQRTMEMMTKTAEQRYEDLLKEDPDIFKFAQLKHIASYLGVTKTSLSRIRKNSISGSLTHF